MVEEQKTEETTKEVPAEEKPVADEVKENGKKPAENDNGDHADGETNGDKATENGNDDVGESSEEELGLLEKPVEILTSKRVRKSVDAYVEPVRETTKEDDLDYSKGPGLKLGDIPFIKHNIDKADTEDLTVIHRMMYRKVGPASKIKRNLREFCGWPFEEGSKEFKSVRSNVIDRLLNSAMKWTLNLLGLEYNQEDMDANRTSLIEFMKKPVMIEKEIPSRKSSGGKKSKTPKKKTPAKKAKKSSDGSEASSNEDSSAEEEEEKPKKKTPAKKTASAKKGSKATQVKIALPKKGGSAKKRKSTAASDSEDEAPLKKKGSKPPTDAELKKVVSAILKDADLETVTMKNVVKQVYDKYTSFDLSERKDFIKSTVKELIS